MKIIVSQEPQEQVRADELLDRLCNGEDVAVDQSNEPVVALLVKHGLADAFGGRVSATAKGREVSGRIFHGPP